MRVNVYIYNELINVYIRIRVQHFVIIEKSLSFLLNNECYDILLE